MAHTSGDTPRCEDGARAELTSDSLGGTALVGDGEGWGARRSPARRGEYKELATRENGWQDDIVLLLTERGKIRGGETRHDGTLMLGLWATLRAGGAPGPTVEEKQVVMRADDGEAVVKKIEEGSTALPADDDGQGEDKW
jgi:hypothetical protein